MRRSLLRPLMGLVTIVVIAAAFGLAANLFRGGFTESVPVTVISQRAGLVMNPDAKVQVLAASRSARSPRSRTCPAAGPPFIWRWIPHA